MLTGIPEDQRQEFLKLTKRVSNKYYKYMHLILNNRISRLETIPMTDPNWVIKRAAADGRLSELKFMLNLLSNSEED